MVQLLTNKRVILHKIESAYGTDSSPTGLLNAIQCRSINFTQLEPDKVERNLIRPYFGASEELTAAYRTRVEIEVELVGSGTAGTPPPFGPMLKTCGLAETINAGVDVQYAPTSVVNPPSASIYVYRDQVRHKMLGVIGDVEFMMSAKEIPIAKFSYTGLLGPIADSALPTVDYSAFKTPEVVNDTNTQIFTLHSVSSLTMQSVSVKVGNVVIHNSRVGDDRILVNNRKTTGEILIESTDVATKDWATVIKNVTLDNLIVEHGTTAGKKVRLESSRVQISEISNPDSEGVDMSQLGLVFVPSSAGNDEFKLTFK